VVRCQSSVVTENGDASFCHSERSEESSFAFACLGTGEKGQGQIARCARNDTGLGMVSELKTEN